MRAVRGAVAVVAVEVVAGHVGQALDAFLHELVVGGLERGMVVVVMLAAAGEDPGVRVAAVLDEQDRGVGAGGAELPHERRALLGDILRAHVRQAVDDVGGGVDAHEEIADFLVHAAVAGEAEVDHRRVEAAAEDRGVHHARPAGAGAVRDRSAVEDDGLRARLEAGELLAVRDADVQELDAVEQGEVERVFAFARVQAFREADLHLLRGRPGDLHPAPLAVLVAGVEVEAADAGGGHVRHREQRLGHLVVGVDRRGVGAEAEHLARAVAAEAPDGRRHLAVGFGRQAVEVALARGVGEGAAFEVRLADVVPGDLLVRADGVTVDGLRSGLRGGRLGVGLGLLGEADGAGAEQGEEEGGGLHGGSQRAVPCVTAIARIPESGFS